MRSSWEFKKYARKYSSFESQYSSTFGSDLRHVLIDHGRSSSFTTNDGIWSTVETDTKKTLELAIITTCKEKVTLEISLCLNLEHGDESFTETRFGTNFDCFSRKRLFSLMYLMSSIRFRQTRMLSEYDILIETYMFH